MAKNKLNITGDAIVEGVMTKNNGQYVMALRNGKNDIEIVHDVYKGIMGRGIFSKIPFLRGIFALIDYLILEIKIFLYSSDYHEDNGGEEPRIIQKIMKKITGKYYESVELAVGIALALFLSALGFIVLPYYVSGKIANYFIPDTKKMMIVETFIRIVMLIIYITIFFIKSDIRRLNRYHGAQHKVIDCLRRGKELTIENVRKCSKYDKHCNMNFVFYVFLISVLCFTFIRNNDMWIRIGMRLLVVPIVAALLYEIINIVNSSDNVFMNFLQFPQKVLQKFIATEPTDDMIEVAIESLQAVFDWREYLGIESEVEEEDYSQYNYEDNVSASRGYKDSYSTDNYNYNDRQYSSLSYDSNPAYEETYDDAQYDDYNGKYFIDSVDTLNAEYKDVMNVPITKQPGYDNDYDYTGMDYEELYKTYTQAEEYHDMYSDYGGGYGGYDNSYEQQDYNNYQLSNDDPYVSSPNLGAQGYSDDDELQLLDRYFTDDNY